jgi:hypothetical protein
MMNFWSTAEYTSDVSPLMHSNTERVGAIKALEDAIIPYLRKVDTGEWKKWRVIYMILNDPMKSKGFRETRRLTRKDMTLDFRVFVDHKPSVDADFNACVDLLVPALERTLPYFSKAKISKDVQEEIRKIVNIAAEEAKAQRQTKQ